MFTYNTDISNLSTQPPVSYTFYAGRSIKSLILQLSGGGHFAGKRK